MTSQVQAPSKDTSEEGFFFVSATEVKCISNEISNATNSSSSSDESSSLSESEENNIFEEREFSSLLAALEEDEDDLSEAPPKTKNELLPEELPPIEETFPDISADFEITLVGRIHSIVESYVVVESVEVYPVLDEGSLVVFEDRTPVGRVFDVFGPVKQPYYSIRVNSSQVGEKLNQCVGQSVFFVREYSSFVDLNSANVKGSDASWFHDEEIPEELQECSDDEVEMKMKKSKNARSHKSRENTKLAKESIHLVDGQKLRLDTEETSIRKEAQTQNVVDNKTNGSLYRLSDSILSKPSLSFSRSLPSIGATSAIPGLTRKPESLIGSSSTAEISERSPDCSIKETKNVE
eukprot:jgi/Galph1/303/GphlegSOOS_G5125.1